MKKKNVFYLRQGEHSELIVYDVFYY